MMNIIYVVMAVGLTVLVTFGGINYINTDVPLRAATSRTLVAQYELILSGVASYKSVNNGIAPTSLDQFKGMLPGGDIPTYSANSKGAWTWSVERSEESPNELAICLAIAPEQAKYVEAVMQFVDTIRQRSDVEVVGGAECGAGDAIDEVVIPSSSGIVLTIKGF
jgi:hypothetical protein